MTALDWVILAGTLAAIIGYGLYKERHPTSESFLRGGRDQKWWTIGLSIMATQASAITFLSMPGQAYEDGLGFVQFYFGQPIAMVLLSAFILPVYYGLKVYTAYEYLEGRFDRKTRKLVAFLFLVSRGLATGISIYAPAIVLSAVLGWPLQLLNFIIGGVVILYTVSGGSRIVSRTQTYQMVIMLAGMVVAAIVIWRQIPVGFDHALHIAGALGKMNAVDTSLRFDTRYTLLSGLTGGLFVGLAYFGTDQSQVGRYLGGETLTQSRLGLMFNGLVKVPMQCLILFVGILLFVFYQFEEPPVWFARHEWRQTAETQQIENAYTLAYAEKRAAVEANDMPRMQAAHAKTEEARKQARTWVKAHGGQPKDNDYVFIDFVTRKFPPGLVGLLIAVILCASMSAVAAALSALGTTTVVDFLTAPGETPSLRAGKWATAGWGLLAIAFAAFAAQLDNLIQAVNILGSLFYGPMLGVFLLGFFVKYVKGTAAFVATLVAQGVVIAVWLGTDIGFLWYNVIGCVVVAGVAPLVQKLR